MESTPDWIVDMGEALANQLRLGVDSLPSILGAILVFMLGWILARVLRRLTKRASQASNRMLGRAFPGGVFGGVQMSPVMTALLGEVVFWSVILLAFTVAAQIGGFSTISQWLERIAVYLPNAIAAFVIVVVGYFVSIFLREQFISPEEAPDRDGHHALAGRITQAAVILVTAVMAIGQLGIDVVLPITLMAVGSSAIALAFAISIALGARTHMSNVFGIRAVKAQLSSGRRIKIDGLAGQILEVTPSHITLETEEGKALVPGKLMGESVTFILEPVDQASLDNG